MVRRHWAALAPGRPAHGWGGLRRHVNTRILGFDKHMVTTGQNVLVHREDNEEMEQRDTMSLPAHTGYEKLSASMYVCRQMDR